MNFLQHIREEQLKCDISSWPKTTRALINSGNQAGLSVFLSYKQYVLRGEFDYLEMFVTPQKFLSMSGRMRISML
jgi:hypothetical protein